MPPARPYPSGPREIALIFLRLGLLGFGGPVASIAMMEEETSRKRNWVSHERFAEMYAVCKLLPGPVGTQMAIYLGSERGGFAGGLFAGTFYVLPSFLIVLGLSYAYVHSGDVQQASTLFLGMQTGALAVILISVYQLARPFLRLPGAWAIAAVSAAIIMMAPRWEPLVILAWGLTGAWLHSDRSRAASLAPLPLFGGFSLSAWASSAGLSAGAQTLGQLFWVCFKAGAFTFGTGLAVVPMLEGDTVLKHQWLTHSQFMDGLAMGQVTPGPVVITSTFIGYVTAGFAGAIAATIGMFLPPFINVLFLVPRIWKRFSGTPGARGFTAWAIPSVVGGIFGTFLRLGETTLDTAPNPWIPIAVFTLTLGAAFRMKLPAWLLIPCAGIAMALGQWVLEKVLA